ncbi:hemoglobin subunit alpha-5-like [Gastrophryne carolinensis]
MHFSGKEKESIAQVWEHVSGHIDDYGAEAMERLFHCYPTTKIYFSNINLDHGSAAVRAQGSKIMHAIGLACKHVDDLDGALGKLSDLHAQKIKVDPANFAFLRTCILVVLAIHLPHDNFAYHHVVWDKFLFAISKVLCSKYR